MRRRRSRRLVHALICAAAFVGIGGLYLSEKAGYAGRTLTSWEYFFRDALAIRSHFNRPDDRLLFLGIDSTSISLSELDLKTLFADVPSDSAEHRALSLMAAGWPWSREVYALLSERLLNAGARAVVFDLLFPKPGTGDSALLDAFVQSRNRIVFGSNLALETIGPGQQAWALSLPSSTIIPDAGPSHPAIGYVNFWPSYNGVVRSAQYQITMEQLESDKPSSKTSGPPLSSLALLAASKLSAPAPQDPLAPKPFRYSGPPGTFAAIPAYQVFVPLYWNRNFSGGAAVRDKVVLVGPYGNWAHDEHSTPFGQMAGPELQLNSVNALLHRAFLREWPAWAGYLLIAAAALSAWLLASLINKMWTRLAAFVLLITSYLFVVKLVYDGANTIILGMPPVLAMALAGLTSFVYDYTHETIEKLRIRRTLESYVSKDIVREILDNPTSYLTSLGGKRAQVALIVTDLRGFTTMAEEMASTQLVAQLNEYLSLMVEDIFACRGSVDKFIGDAILAVWGHFNSSGPAGDTALAVEALLRMKETLARLNADWQQRGLRPFAMGCGLNFGEVVFGNMGSARKMEPTVIGDTVNVTARLESLTKDYGRDLLIGEAAAELIRDSYTLQLVDRVVLKGKTRPLKIFAIVDRATVQLEQPLLDYLENYRIAQEAYAFGTFEKAIARFQTCLQYQPGDRLIEMYIERCRALMSLPPREWTGVHYAAHK
ncbi:MAG TPA: adenylate/guanylate cyclase domain-containing protein [Verrucomicrobiae bacterium]|nr:adenylate/guanylate cyclase domain-containing protein [Verrucomicrobiae bacterium]